MNSLVARFIAGWMAFSLVGCCGLALGVAQPRPDTLLFFVADGYNTVAGDAYHHMYDRALAIADLVHRQSGVATRLISAGFTGDYVNADDNERLYYRMPDDSVYPELTNPRTAATSSFLSEMRRWASTFPRAAAVLIGHSHGGWLMMKLALALPPETPILLLATLDPISLRLCDRRNFVRDVIRVIRNPRHPESEDNGCPPQDLRLAFPRIHDRISRQSNRQGKWLNFYQQQFVLLHSGPIAEADENLRLAYPCGETIRENAHSAMPEDSRIWDRIQRTLLDTLSKLEE